MRNAIVAQHLPCAIAGVGCTGWGTTVDHIIPHGLGGPDIAENLRPACTHCNSAKGRRMTAQARGGGSPFFRDGGYQDSALLNTSPRSRWDALTAASYRKDGATRR